MNNIDENIKTMLKNLKSVIALFYKRAVSFLAGGTAVTGGTIIATIFHLATPPVATGAVVVGIVLFGIGIYVGLCGYVLNELFAEAFIKAEVGPQPAPIAPKTTVGIESGYDEYPDGTQALLDSAIVSLGVSLLINCVAALLKISGFLAAATLAHEVGAILLIAATIVYLATTLLCVVVEEVN